MFLDSIQLLYIESEALFSIIYKQQTQVDKET